MKLIDALRQGDTVTENGMATNSSSLNFNVDLFYNIGAMRGQDKSRLISTFSKALNEDPIRAMKILFWARDIRQGAGERQIFKDVIEYLAEYHTEILAKNICLIPEYGRWDDILVLVGTKLERDAFALIEKALIEDTHSLSAKWMPRKGPIASKLRNYLGLTPKTYRKLLVGLTNVVEQLMCAKKWDEIDFSKLPSLASARYQKAFWKNAEVNYKTYIDNLKSGKAKINAGAVYPYDVIKSMKLGNYEVAQEQWKVLPNFLQGNDEMILPLVDVSGSMTTTVGNNPNLTCLDVAVSLGLYISERNVGPFKDSFITFSERPTLEVLNGSLGDRLVQMSSSNWGYNTNIEAVFDLILDMAKRNGVNQSQMPKKILILSDMQFDSANENKWNPTAQQMIAGKYRETGYEMPNIIYWNLASRHGDVPVSFNETGTALISGFSPAILKSVLGSKEFTPESIMDETIMSDRYIKITI